MRETGRSIPVVHLLWEQTDRVRFSAPRPTERRRRRSRGSSRGQDGLLLRWFDAGHVLGHEAGKEVCVEVSEPGGEIGL